MTSMASMTGMSGMSHTASMTASMTSAAAAATSAASSGHGGMDMGGGGNSCKISMLWNWYTIDACFLSSSWHVKSHGAFAATCIGIAAIVVLLEFFRRLGKEYDSYLVRQYKRSLAARPRAANSFTNAACEGYEPPMATFRATPLQQLIRAIMHAVVFGLAYIVMLLAMYYNGYVIFSIILGAGIGKFLCDWMVVKIPLTGFDNDAGKNIDHQIDEPRSVDDS